MTGTQIQSAAVAGLIALGTAMIALLTEAQSFGDISGPAYAVAIIGALVTIAKDLQSSARDPDA